MASPVRITSRQNPRVKDAVRLRNSRDRLQFGRFLIDGIREIRRAIESGVRPLEAFVCDPMTESADAHSVISLIQSAGAELLPVAPDVFAKLCFGDRDEAGLIVVAETPYRDLSNLQLPASPLVAIVESLEKPGNLGAILRSADAAGIDAIIAADLRTDLFNPNTIRASLGTVFRPNVVVSTTPEAITWAQEKKLRLVAARPDAETDYTAIDFKGGLAIVLGSEALGLSDAWQGGDIQAVRLPMRGLADSLNVSTTAAVLFYEALRQRGPL
jgi:RNA methyltransferase, TrmH family